MVMVIPPPKWGPAWRTKTVVRLDGRGAARLPLRARQSPTSTASGRRRFRLDTVGPTNGHGRAQQAQA
eukprot:325199-Pyramimonas_sp.AAC.1